MKKLMLALLLLTSLSGLTQSSDHVGYVTYTPNTTPASDTDLDSGRFAVVTLQKDTLFINVDNGSGQLLCQMWKEGYYDDSTPYPVIIMTDTTTLHEVGVRLYGEEFYRRKYLETN